MYSEVLFAPASVGGANAHTNVQLSPAATVWPLQWSLPAGPASKSSAPLSLMLWMSSGEPPVLVMVNVWSVRVPTAWAPKSCEDGATVAAAGVRAVPDSAAVMESTSASMCRSSDWGPAPKNALGMKRASTVQLAPGLSVSPVQLSLTARKPAPARV